MSTDPLSEANEPQVSQTRNFLIASFVPPSLSGIPGIEIIAKSHPYLFPEHEILQGCRIVMTTDAQGGYVWTFIPLARGPQGVGVDEGDWPRNVSVLGEIILLTRERWDEFKCNPDYECYIPLSPGIPIVSWRATTSKTASTSSMPPPPVPNSPTPIPQRQNTRSPTPFPKRTASDFSDPVDSGPRKRPRTRIESGSDTEVEEVDSFKTFEATKSKLRREKDKESRARDDMKSASFRMASMMNDLPNLSTSANTNGVFSNGSPSKKVKEKVAMETDPVQTKRHRGYGSSPDPLDEPHEQEAQPEQDFSAFHSSKRPKVVFGNGLDERQRAWERRSREYQRYVRRHGKVPFGRKWRKEEDFWQDVDFKQFQGRSFSVEVDDSESAGNAPNSPKVKQEREQGSSNTPIYVSETDDDAEGETDHMSKSAGESTAPEDGSVKSDEEGEENKKPRFDPYSLDPDYQDALEAEREAQIRASRRKLEELNSHDYERRESRRRHEEERARKQAEAKRRREQREREEKYWNSYKRPSNGYPFFTSAPWGTNTPRQPPPPFNSNRTSDPYNSPYYGNAYSAGSSRRTAPSTALWTARSALERYNKLSGSFDSFKPTPEAALPPLNEIPWPVLFPPGFTIDQVDWNNVEKFFASAEALMGGKSIGKVAWKEFLKASTRRFHPDRWRARGFIGDKGYGSDVEDKVNHVAKVLTPLYRAVN